MTIRISRPMTPAVFWTPRAFAVLLLLMVVALAGAQQPPDAAQSPSDILTSSTYAHDEQQQVLEVFDQAIDAGVPVDLLVPRLQEGLAKRVGSGQMVRALDRELESLQQARDVMRTVEGAEPIHRDTASWARAANLLSSGQLPEVLYSLVEFSLPRPEAFRQATLLYLAVVDWGVDSELSLVLTKNTVLSEIHPDDFPAVAELFAVGQRNRLSPEEVVDRLSEALSDGLSISQMRRLFRR